MEGCNSLMRRVAVITVLMLVCAGCASASFKKCYEGCYHDCTAAAKEQTVCIAKCLFKCAGKHSAMAPYGPDSCNFHCAVDNCPRFGNDVDKVEDCVTKCGNNNCTS